MLKQEYLHLRQFRLSGPEEWTPVGKGLTFVFLDDGKGEFCCNSVRQGLSANDALVFAHAPRSKVTCPTGESLSGWQFSLLLEHLYPLFGAGEVSLLPSLEAKYQQGRFYAASTPLASALQRLIRQIPAESSIDHRGQVLRVASASLAEEFKELHLERSGYVRIEEHLLQVFEGLTGDDLLSLSVGELAERFGCGRRHLNRLFHQFFGLSVAALRMEMRLLKAVSLLRDGDEKVINIAEKAGFNHLGLFNTCFKRRFGVSPGKWRSSTEARVPAAPQQNVSACSIGRLGLCPCTAPENARPVASPGPTVAHKAAAQGRTNPRKTTATSNRSLRAGIAASIG